MGSLKGDGRFCRIGKYEIVTGGKQSPVAGATASAPLDCNITWLLQKVGADLQADFAVDRSNAACRTPRRNPEVEAAAEELSRLAAWMRRAGLDEGLLQFSLPHSRLYGESL